MTSSKKYNAFGYGKTADERKQAAVDVLLAALTRIWRSSVEPLTKVTARDALEEVQYILNIDAKDEESFPM